MSHTKWRKTLRDLSANKLRSFFVILAIAIGVFGISTVANSYAILKREMDKNYQNTTPSSTTLLTSSLGTSEIKEISSLPYIDEVEEREKVVGRVQTGENEWKDIWLFVIDDFSNIRLDTFIPENGAFPPNSGEILFERKSLNFANAQIGKDISVKIRGGSATVLKLTGSVHDPGLAPSWMEGIAYGYITRDTYHLLGGKDNVCELKIKVTGDTLDIEHIREITCQLKAYLENKGTHVTQIDIPKPGKHPHFTQMAGLLFLMEAFGILALILSSVLVSNMVTSILEQQIRQIGIMKAIGATSFQIAALYQGLVIILSITALLFAMPLGISAGRGYAELAASILNFNIYSYDIPVYIFIMELAAGLLIPGLVSLIPIHKNSRITVREAIQNYGINEKAYSGKKGSDLKVLSGLPRPFLLSLRNTFRKKGRLIFTLLVMAVGGTGFIVAMNIYASMYNTVDEKINAFRYDIQISFEKPQAKEKILDMLKEISGIKQAEAWGGTAATRVYQDKTTGNSFQIIAPPSDTKLLKTPPMYSGRWLDSKDTNAIVINQRVVSEEPDIRVGTKLTLRINGIDTEWVVVGISKELLGLPTAYVNMEYLSKLMGYEGYAGSAVIVTRERTPAEKTLVAKELEQTLADKGMPLCSLVKLDDYRTSLVNHLLIIATFLITMSVLVLLVGGLGLATSISINTMERTREIGIMRAIGAPPYYITSMIVAEGVLIGIMSWVISFLLSWPLSKMISNQFGIIFFDAPLEFSVSYSGFILWFIIVILFAAAASFYPSRNASKMEIQKLYIMNKLYKVFRELNVLLLLI
jgi:putative ABC transport system permease protein